MTKYGFPNSLLRCCFQLSPKPAGTLRVASLSRAAALFLWMLTSCSSLSGDEGGLAGSSCPTRAFLAGLAYQESGSEVRLRALAILGTQPPRQPQRSLPEDAHGPSDLGRADPG